jgi:hypothetical protein
MPDAPAAPCLSSSVRAIMEPIKFAIISGIALSLFHEVAVVRAEDNLDAIRHELASPVYETRVGAVTQLLHMGQKQPLHYCQPAPKAQT